MEMGRAKGWIEDLQDRGGVLMFVHFDDSARRSHSSTDTIVFFGHRGVYST